ncbi:MAG: acyl-CoA synthetase [Porticoccaceae bacterium]|nr:MAG: acyl-CoA synthetase [Porticoccaceae bacterium]
MGASTKPNPEFRPADFATLVEALEYAARGSAGLNFYSGRGALQTRLSYRELAARARRLARGLIDLGLRKGERVALIAETSPEFVVTFFACQYAGLIPVPLPAMIKLGAHSTFVTQLANLLKACDAGLALASRGYLPFLDEARQGLATCRVAAFDELESAAGGAGRPLPDVEPDDIAYLQYTSGSTRFPKGVMIHHRNAMANLSDMVVHGVGATPEDKLVSWLPFYHDMGLVGFLLVPAAAQLEVHYLATHDFAMRPRLWLSLMTETRATISFSPCFGYDLCARRLHNGEADRYDLRHWRVAGIGAEMIRPRSLDLFATTLQPAGFDPRAFLACYGMAECTLGVSFSAVGQGYTTDYVDMGALTESNRVVLLEEGKKTSYGRHLVNCGRPLPSFEVEIRDEQGRPLGDYQAGAIYLRGPSIMSGYFGMPEETAQHLSPDGWLDTGDIGYLANGTLTITGRKKDLIIIHGRNIWPQDLEQVCESQPEVRPGDAVAFSVGGDGGDEVCVVLVQSKEQDEGRRRELVERLTRLLREELSLDCLVELVPPRSLPITSSGKLSRSKARVEYLAGRLGRQGRRLVEEDSGRAKPPEAGSAIPAAGG